MVCRKKREQGTGYRMDDVCSAMIHDAGIAVGKPIWAAIKRKIVYTLHRWPYRWQRQLRSFSGSFE
ncbi:hypothetical protein M413DRAFT_112731 [Hebeloma cylindrosporum]|uniref:Uncharacterized protein n=1 Tax=Hebeloma cylindrosporum TaxID=76867 RepID=A0A0C2Z932_HEBCY|nr:hypothetical protein M413DRAFT_112731 [Hebeloma cylindrosporum h7]